MRKQRKRVYQVTMRQILSALIIAAIALTAAFEMGVLVGKRRLINAEREAARQNGMRWSAVPSVSKEESSAQELPPDRSTQRPRVRKNTEQAMEAPTGGDLPLESSPDQTIEQSETEKGAAQYTVQVGTFGSYQNAENLVDLLKSYEYKSWLRLESRRQPSTGGKRGASAPRSTEERTLYSVCVGGFNTRDEAEQFGRSLQDRLSFVTNYVVRKIQE